MVWSKVSFGSRLYHVCVCFSSCVRGVWLNSLLKNNRRTIIITVVVSLVEQQRQKLRGGDLNGKRHWNILFDIPQNNGGSGRLPFIAMGRCWHILGSCGPPRWLISASQHLHSPRTTFHWFVRFSVVLFCYQVSTIPTPSIISGTLLIQIDHFLFVISEGNAMNIPWSQLHFADVFQHTRVFIDKLAL